MTAEQERTAKIPPRVFVRTAWVLHRALLRISGGRIGLRPPGKAFGMLRLTTVGRRSGQPRVAIGRRLRLEPGFDTEALLDSLDLNLLWDTLDEGDGGRVLGALLARDRLVILNDRHSHCPVPEVPGLLREVIQRAYRYIFARIPVEREEAAP